MQIVKLQARQARIYGRLRELWNLVCAQEIAELYASAQGWPDDRALIYLERSILRGEFGSYPRRHVFWLPDPPRIDEYPHPLKITNEHVMGMRAYGHPIIADLWLSCAEAVTWLCANNVGHIPTSLTNAAVIEREATAATAEIAGAEGGAVDAIALPPAADPEFIDLKSEPPKLPRYRAVGALPRATPEQVDDCIKKIAELDGGQTNRHRIRDWGRHWLRTYRNADTMKKTLERRFKDPEHKSLRRPDGGAH